MPGYTWGKKPFPALGVGEGHGATAPWRGVRDADWPGGPMSVHYTQQEQFAQQVERTFGSASTPSGTLYDPRGDRALSSMPSDYFPGVYDPEAEIVDLGAEARKVIDKGVPEFRPMHHRNAVVDYDVLANASSGLSPDGVRSLGEALEQYDPEVVQAIHVPVRSGQPDVVDAVGFVYKGGREPMTYIEQEVKAFSGPVLSDVLARYGRERTPYQSVDANGVVHKYAPRTGPYDAPGTTRPGGLAGIQMGAFRRARNEASDMVRTAALRVNGCRVRGMGSIGGDTAEGESKVSVPNVIGMIACGLLAVLGGSLLTQGMK